MSQNGQKEVQTLLYSCAEPQLKIESKVNKQTVRQCLNKTDRQSRS